jgi:ABC-type sugar transport system ATPase subunit
MATVTIRDLEVRYGNFVAVRDVNLKIEDGEFCVFLGPSGCGKHPRCAIAGLVTPMAGDIIIDNEVVNQLTPANATLAWYSRAMRFIPI